MTSKITFPRIGSERTVPVYEVPVRFEGEDDASFNSRVADHEKRKHISLTVKLVARHLSRAWAFNFAKALAADGKRIRDLTEKGEVVHGGVTQEGAQEIEKLQREVLEGCLVRVDGVVVGETDVSALKPADAIPLLDDIDMLGPVAMAARRAQVPFGISGRS